jgi:DNA-binding transcriptional MerR regulator
MTENPLLRTGAFARAASLSVKALRLYHEMGLLVPAVVDPATGYRAYSPAQLTDATIIRLLREVGVPLRDVHAVLDARDTGLLRKVLTEQANRFQVGLDAVARLVDDLGVADDADAGAVVLRRESARLVLAVDAALPVAELGHFLNRSAGLLRETARASGAVIDGRFGACYPPQVDEDRQDVTAFLPITAPTLVPAEFGSAGVRIDELPACDLAVLEHRGPLWELAGCYRRLGTWVAFHAVPADLPVRELYSAPVDERAENTVIELLWPVILDKRTE